MAYFVVTKRACYESNNRERSAAGYDEHAVTLIYQDLDTSGGRLNQ